MTTFTVQPARAAVPVPGYAVRAIDLHKRYGRGDTAVTALDGVDLAIDEGSFTAVMGPSGSGKSTLLHCLAGLDTITGGQVWLGDTELGGLPDRALTALRRDQIGFVFQSFNLLPTLTAYENIVLPLELAGRRVDRDHLRGIVGSLGLDDRLSHRPSELSGGQQQRVAIARALVTRPRVVFADEPTGALDTANGQVLLAHLRRASRERGQTIVLVTHDPMAAAYADRLVLLADGRVADDFTNPDADSALAALKGLGG